MKFLRIALVLCLMFTWVATVLAAPGDYFCIEVLDEATGRGIPLVELQTTDKCVYYTDSNGLVAFNEPGLMNETVWFNVSSHGYEFPHESFGIRGTALKVVAGEKATLKMKRINIAERLYRITGRGIYRDTLLLGKTPPIEHGALDGKVMGQDSTLTAILNGKLYWFWGDTNRPGHALGNYFTSGGYSELPVKGGLDPAVGVNLNYFTDPKSGFVKAMIPLKRSGSNPVWIDAVMLVTNDKGKECIVGRYNRVKDMKPFECGLVVFNDQTNQFDEVKELPVNAKLAPTGHPFRVNIEGQEYYYFPAPYPCERVKNDWNSLTDLNAYEAFTCLQDGGSYAKKGTKLDRDSEGKLIWKWRKDTSPLTPSEIEELAGFGMLKRDETPYRLRNLDDKKAVQLHNSTVYWNEYKKKWVMIGVQTHGDSFLGEVWYAEANAPEGPWLDAKKVATHAKQFENMDFYNPLQHPYFAQDGGRIIYFEGTYTNTFSGTIHQTPNYEYNQLMYRLDLSDPRLKLPEPPVGLNAAQAVK